jgi:hypothetical protein
MLRIVACCREFGVRLAYGVVPNKFGMAIGPHHDIVEGSLQIDQERTELRGNESQDYKERSLRR